MPQITNIGNPSKPVLIQDRISYFLVLIYMVLAMLVLLVTPIFFYVSAGNPFLNTFYAHNLPANTTQLIYLGDWNDRLSFFLITYVIGLLYILSGLYLFRIKRFEQGSLAYGLFSASCAIALCTLSDLFSTGVITPVWIISLSVMGGALINLALWSPDNIHPVVPYPFLGWIGYAVSGFIALLALVGSHDVKSPLFYFFPWHLGFIFLGISLVFFMAMNLLRISKTRSSIVRKQTRLILWGAFLSYIPSATLLLAVFLNSHFTFSPFYLLPLACFPVFVAYAFFRYHSLNADHIVGRVVLYFLLTGLTVAGYVLLVSGMSLILGGVLNPTSPIIVGLFIFLLAIGLDPVRKLIQKLIDRFFFRGKTDYGENQQAFGRDLAQTVDRLGIVNLLRQYVDHALLPSQLHVYVFDSISGQYVASMGVDGYPTSDLRFSINSKLVELLSKRRGILLLKSSEDLSDEQHSERARLALLSALVFVPLPGSAQLVGWLALGERLSGAPYSNRDLAFLENLCNQAAMAITNARLYKEIKEANLEKSRVVSFVAHELKNPMTSIKGYTELVAGGTAGPINEMQSSFLSTVRSNVERMNTIVSDLNDLTKIEVGTLSLDYQAVQVKEVLDDVVRSLKRQIEEKEQKLTIILPDEISPVQTDPLRLAQILINLVSNANKYTPDGGKITIGIEEKEGEKGTPIEVDSILMWVKDAGIGIEEEEQKMVFQQYFRSDSAKEMASGTGLGLAITKRLVEMQGGCIWFESEQGKGSTFFFSLPISETH
jgi:signal transduction histidine kinase